MTAWQSGGNTMHGLRIAHNYFNGLGDDAVSVQGHDGVGVQNGTAATVSTTAGSPNVVGTGTSWTGADVGKRIAIENGGTGGVIPFESVITVVTDTTHITLRDNVTSNTTTKKAIYGFNRVYDFVIANNIIHSADADDAGGSGGGVFCRGAEHGLIINNIINGTYYTGISLAYMVSDDYNNLVWCRNIHTPPDLVVRDVAAHRKPPDVRIWRLRNQSRVGTVPPSTSTPHWPACLARR